MHCDGIDGLIVITHKSFWLGFNGIQENDKVNNF